MHLCYLADPTSSHTVKWLSYFIARGDEVHLLGWNHPTDPALADVHYHHLPDELPAPFIAPVRSVLWRLGGWLLVQMRQMQYVLERIQPDIFDILMLNAGEFPAALARRGPLVVTPWGSDLLVYPAHYSLFKRWLLHLALRRANLVLCNSAALVRASMALGVQPNRIRRVGQIVDMARFRPGLDATVVRAQLGVTGEPLLLSPRNLQPLYCIDVLIRAMPAVLARYPGAKLILLGKRDLDSHYVAQLEDAIDQLGLRESVLYAGWFNNDAMPHLYTLADLVLSVPSSDSRPSSVFEAMACGVPVVVSDLAAVREIVVPGETGLVAPVGDAAATATAILELLSNTALRERMITQALDFVRREGDYATQMAKVAACYAELVSER